MKVWFITGTSKGSVAFGPRRPWRGETRWLRTARHPESLKGLVDRYRGNVFALALDVYRQESRLRCREDSGGDVRADRCRGVNNAGYGQFGAVEELAEQDAP